MRNESLRWSTIALALAAGLGLAVAQTASDVQPNTSKPDQGGKQEPTSKTTGETQQGGVMVNGALNVPGAPANAATIPAKFSAEHDANDDLPTIAFTFKQLSAEERRAIYEAIKAAGAAPHGKIGAQAYEASAQLPADVPLAAIPDDLAARFPDTEGYRYVMSGDKVLLISPTARVVVGVLTP